jgi:hypothetical protein
MSDDGLLPWKRPLSKCVKHRHLAKFLARLKNLKGHMGALGVNMVRCCVFIHVGSGVGTRTTTRATTTRRAQSDTETLPVTTTQQPVNAVLSLFSENHHQGGGEKGSALSGCHGIRAKSLFFSLL